MKQLLIRHEALAHCQMLFQDEFNLLVIEGQAGQGKTSLAHQLMESAPLPTIWHSCQQDEAAPLTFCQNLATSLNLPPLAPLMADYLQQLQQQICQTSLNGCLLLIDDYHLIMNEPQNLDLLEKLIATRTLKLGLITRHYKQRIGHDRQTIFIDNELLAMNLDETARLLTAQTPLAAAKIRQIHELTEGWASGICLIRERLRQGDHDLPAGNILQAMDLIGETQSAELIMLANLERIPAGLPEERAVLDDLAARACFVRRDAQYYTLHHLLRDALVKRQSSLGAAFKHRWARRAGQWCLNSGLIEEGLTILAMGGCLEELQTGIREHGMGLLARGRFSLVEELLDNLSDRLEDPWLQLMRGTILLALKPEETQPWLIRSLKGMQAAGDHEGELHATARLIEYEALMGGSFGHIDMSRAIGLLGNHPLNLLAAIALGSCYDRNGDDAAEMVRRLQNKLAQSGRSQLDLFSSLVPCVHQILRTDVSRALFILDRYVSAESALSPAGRFAIHFALLNILRIRGRDFQLTDSYIQSRFHHLLTRSHLGGLQSLWLSGRHLSEDNAQLALETLMAADTRGCRNLQAIALSWQTLYLAQLGRHDEANQVAIKARELREQEGGYYYTRQCRIILACARSLADPFAEDELRQLINEHSDHQDASIQAMAQGYLSSCQLQRGRHNLALRSIEAMLITLGGIDCCNFMGFMPQTFLPLLIMAVQGKRQAGRARMIARQQLSLDILDDGRLVPRIKVQALEGGKLELNHPGRTIQLHSRQQVRLIASLINAEGEQLSVQQLHQELWPGQDYNRARLANLMKRLRSQMEQLTGHKQHYLTIRGGHAILRHMFWDDTNADLAQGIELLGEQRPWSASVPLMRAFDQLRRPMVLPAEPELIRRAALLWCPQLKKTHDLELALEQANQARKHAPRDARLNRLTYDLLMENNQKAQALNLLDELRDNLRKYSPEDREAVMDNFWEG